MSGAGRRLRLLMSMVIAAAAAATLRAQSAAPPPGRQIVVDFYALAADRSPVPDLTAADVVVRIDGRTRTVKSLKLVTQGQPPPDDPLSPAPAAAPPPFGTNLEANQGRSFIVVVDDESFRPGLERAFHSAFGAFVGSIGLRDRVSLITVPHGDMRSEFTTDHDSVAEAARNVVGRAPDQESGSDAACRSRTVLESLTGLLSSLTGGEGPTSVLFVTASMLGPRRDAIPTRAPGMCELTTEHFRQVGEAAAAARAHFFIVRLEDGGARISRASENIAGVGSTGRENPLEGLEHLAGVTGAVRLPLTKPGEPPLRQIARETTAYYSAVVDGLPNETEGRHGLDVKVARDGIEVRARPQIDLRWPASAGPSATKTPADLLRVPAIAKDLPLRVAAYVSRGEGGRMNVIAAAEPAEPGVKLAALSAALFNMRGTLVSQFTASADELAALPVLGGLSVTAGTYRLRAAAVDTTGRTGTADIDVVANMVAVGPLRLSSIVVGLSRNGTFGPRLQFGNDPVAIAYMDVLGGQAGMPIVAVLELAATLDGPAIFAAPMSFEATSSPTQFTARCAIPIGALAPGDYVVRAIVGVEGQPPGRVVRTIRKVAP